MNRGRGRGGGFGGGGRGWRNRFYATGLTGRQRAATGWPVWGGAVPCTYPAAGPPMTGEQELEVLKNKAAYFEDALKEIQKQIEELQSRNKHDSCLTDRRGRRGGHACRRRERNLADAFHAGERRLP